MVGVFPPAPVRGVGRTGGFKFMVEDLTDAGPKVLQEQNDKLAAAARKRMWPNDPKRPLLNVMPNVFRANIPQLYVNMNRAQCISMGVPLADAFATLQVCLGSLYVNDFNRFGRTWQVVVQADAPARNQVESAGRLKVRNASGSMVALGSLADIEMVNGPLILTRYNMHSAAAIQGAPEMGVSSRQSIDLMQDLADRELLSSMGYEWTELSYLELQAGNTAMLIFGFAVVAVFLVLAAQYESWSLPMAVILVVPMCLLGAIAGVIIAKMDINIFTQIGFVVLVGLASKNAILIVEYAKRSREGGMQRNEAALAACRLRLRPIMMTSSAFILGVSSLMIAHGAGAEMRRTLGTAVFSGMLGVTLFGMFLTPVFFISVDRLSQSRLFSSPAVRFVGKAAMILLTLGFVGIAYRTLAKSRNGNSEKNEEDTGG
jgi:multidrug efflux pump